MPHDGRQAGAVLHKHLLEVLQEKKWTKSMVASKRMHQLHAGASVSSKHVRDAPVAAHREQQSAHATASLQHRCTASQWFQPTAKVSK